MLLVPSHFPLREDFSPGRRCLRALRGGKRLNAETIEVLRVLRVEYEARRTRRIMRKSIIELQGELNLSLVIGSEAR